MMRAEWVEIAPSCVYPVQEKKKRSTSSLITRPFDIVISLYLLNPLTECLIHQRIIRHQSFIIAPVDNLTPLIRHYLFLPYFLLV